MIPNNNFPKIQNNTLQFRNTEITNIPSYVIQTFILPLYSSKYLLSFESLYSIIYVFEIHITFLDIDKNVLQPPYIFLYNQYNVNSDIWITEKRDVENVPKNSVYCTIKISDSYKDQKLNQSELFYIGPTLRNLNLTIYN